MISVRLGGREFAIRQHAFWFGVAFRPGVGLSLLSPPSQTARCFLRFSAPHAPRDGRTWHGPHTAICKEFNAAGLASRLDRCFATGWRLHSATARGGFDGDRAVGRRRLAYVSSRFGFGGPVTCGVHRQGRRYRGR